MDDATNPKALEQRSHIMDAENISKVLQQIRSNPFEGS
jgi:hypothetical protein